MRTRLAHYRSLLRATFWFIPGAMIIMAVILAAVALAIDRSPYASQLPDWVSAGGADGARDLLSVVAASMITVAGLGFSITIVALVLASTQFGPRLLTLFMRDLTSQFTLGVFAGTFVYCILVLRSIRGPTEVGPEFVPQLSLTIAIVLTILSVAALVFFFHHVAVAIQAPKVVASVARDLDRAIDRIYPVDVGPAGPAPDPRLIPDPAVDPTVPATTDGYIQVVDDAAILAIASSRDLTVGVMVRPGLFVVRAAPMLVVRPTLDAETEAALHETVIIGDVRTSEDDVEFAIRQLIEVALRSLSAAINDPFTAMAAIDRLAAALARLATIDFPARYRYDNHGALRVVASISTFASIARAVFSRVRHYAGGSPLILYRLLEAVAALGPHVRDEDDRAAVREEAEAIVALGRAALTGPADLAELEKRYEAGVSALGGRVTPVEPRP